MAEDLIWCSAQLPHPYEPGVRVRERKTEIRGTGAPPSCTIIQGASGVCPWRGSQGWGSSTDEDEHYSRNRVATPWVSSSSQPPPPPAERIPRLLSNFLLASIHHQLLTQIAVWLGFRTVDCPLRLRTDEAFSTFRDDDKDWRDAWHTHQPCSSSRRATLISNLHNDCEQHRLPMVHALMHRHREHRLGAVRKKFPANSENTNRKTRLSKCRTLSTTIIGHVTIRVALEITQLKELPHHCLSNVFVKAPIAILNAQTFVKNQIKDSREHTHTHHLCCHGRTNSQRYRNFSDRHPPVLFFEMTHVMGCSR